MNRFLAAASILVWMGIANGQTPISEASAGCTVRDRRIALKYSGECVGGLANGSGIASGAQWSYSGAFVDGWPDGVGLMTGPSGDEFAGLWRKGSYKGDYGWPGEVWLRMVDSYKHRPRRGIWDGADHRRPMLEPGSAAARTRATEGPEAERNWGALLSVIGRDFQLTSDGKLVGIMAFRWKIPGLSIFEHRVWWDGETEMRVHQLYETGKLDTYVVEGEAIDRGVRVDPDGTARYVFVGWVERDLDTIRPTKGLPQFIDYRNGRVYDMGVLNVPKYAKGWQMIRERAEAREREKAENSRAFWDGVANTLAAVNEALQKQAMQLGPTTVQGLTSQATRALDSDGNTGQNEVDFASLARSAAAQRARGQATPLPLPQLGTPPLAQIGARQPNRPAPAQVPNEASSSVVHSSSSPAAGTSPHTKDEKVNGVQAEAATERRAREAEQAQAQAQAAVEEARRMKEKQDSDYLSGLRARITMAVKKCGAGDVRVGGVIPPDKDLAGNIRVEFTVQCPGRAGVRGANSYFLGDGYSCVGSDMVQVKIPCEAEQAHVVVDRVVRP